MSAFTSLSTALRFVFFFGLLVTGLSISHAYDGEDWVLVKYFKDNLDQAKQGDSNAMFKVGQLYERGRGTPQDINQAIGWYHKAIQGGHQYARARLGIMLYEGTGTAKNLTKALAFLKPAAEAKTPEAEYYMGIIYERGDGVPSNRNEAINWYKQAVQHGSYRAKSRLQALDKGYIKVGSTAALPKASKASNKVNIAAALREAVLSGNWQRGELAAGFLPSGITNCTSVGKNTIRCISEKQQRDTGSATITYVTKSTIWGFNSKDEFKVKYQNSVLSHARKGEAIVAEDDEGDYAISASSGKPGIGLGIQKTVHKLECEMEQANKLVCLKNRTRQLTYNNVK